MSKSYRPGLPKVEPMRIGDVRGFAVKRDDALLAWFAREHLANEWIMTRAVSTLKSLGRFVAEKP